MSLSQDRSEYLAGAREPTATGVRAEPEAARRAYLDLLKIAICDLVGPTTMSVGRTEDGGVLSRRLAGDELRLRSAGMDWPLQGLTMVGLRRLDDLQSCVESVVRDGVAGDMIEAGAWRGGASLLIRATLDSLGEYERTVWVADSFRGFPERSASSPGRDDLAAFDFLRVPLAEVRDRFARLGYGDGVEFVPGFFEETMPRLRGGRWSLVRLDGDTYEATKLTAETLYPGLARGGYVIVDDFGAYEECRQAIEEFREANAISEPLAEVDWTAVRWRRETDAPRAAEERPRRAAGLGSRNDAAGSGPPRVPTMRELELEARVRALEQRLGDAAGPRPGAVARLRSALGARLGGGGR